MYIYLDINYLNNLTQINYPHILHVPHIYHLPYLYIYFWHYYTSILNLNIP